VRHPSFKIGGRKKITSKQSLRREEEKRGINILGRGRQTNRDSAEKKNHQKGAK